MDLLPTRSARRIKLDSIKKNRHKSLICVLENPQNIQNIGAVIRVCNNLGVGKLYIVDEKDVLPKLNPENSRAAKATWWREIRTNKSLNVTSVSAVKWTYIHKFNTTEECLDYLAKEKFTSIVTSPHIKGKKNVVLQDDKFTDRHLAVWFGNESSGVSEEVVNDCDRCIQIPMSGIVESFNLAVSTGIVLYEITKNRISNKN